MGQYYQPITKDESDKITVYNRNVIIDGKPEYTLAKLTEHSWIGNSMMDSFCYKLYNEKTPKQIMWLGDYSDDFMTEYPDGFNNLSIKEFEKIYKLAWNNKEKLSIDLELNQFDITNKYLVNHTKREFVDMSSYYQKSVMIFQEEEWCLHPLSLLTCVGNGCGGGDYSNPTKNSTMDYVGSWAWNLISIEDCKPENYEEIYPTFKEKGWED